MFITVRYGEREEALFNPNCKTMLLLENIRQRCRLGEDVEVDLADPEGNVKHLIDASLRYANEVLKDRETFVLIKVENDDSRKPSYIPLLNDNEFIDAAFLARLSTRDQSSNGSAKGSRKRREGNKSNASKKPPKSTTPTGRKGKR
ncbi:uncharacterized protein CXorf65 homolog isoform X2 [Anneissia japonica]|uniref:uncharacterized protein CXorf65 homolog isoform X2 n=1 Tax=Anneissia japonica TaxID=1529436 RepID=UPI001425510E|nr:uncharacterized protein CXorf65 homolog isoform X2 [Anneissia japonica]